MNRNLNDYVENLKSVIDPEYHKKFENLQEMNSQLATLVQAKKSAFEFQKPYKEIMKKSVDDHCQDMEKLEAYCQKIQAKHDFWVLKMVAALDQIF